MKRFLCLLAVCMLLMPAVVTGDQEEKNVFTQAMMKNSLVSVGNTERIQAAMDKARRGERVTIAYLGGSITEGALAQPQPTGCYAYLSAQLFAQRYMPDAAKLNYVNAGISGTPSVLGITRLEKDVLSRAPDVVFVEFAVNDNNQLIYRIVYESMIRKLLAAPSQPAVVLLFTFMESGYSCQSHMQQVGSHYDLGMISVKDAVLPQINLGRMKWSDYSSDYTHPNTQAHAFIAQMIGYYFDQAEATAPQPFSVPEETRYGKRWEALENLAQDDPRILSRGSFAWGPDRCYSYAMGWKQLSALGSAEPLTIQAECSRFIVAFKQEKTAARGVCEVWVDGVRMKVLPGQSDGAWGNIVTEMIDLGDESAMHTIEFRMAEGDERKSFTILDIGIVP